MANPFRQQSRFRKLVYFGLILALFTGSLVHRRFLIEPEAMALQLREQSRGEVELTSSAVRHTFLGSRGIATCVLWWTAKEKQKKQEWNELELVVRSITKLQPHFSAPWRYLSWNLAFNVAVECDRTRDKYFYVSRGLQLLAEGERRNQGTQDEAAGPGGRALRFPGNPDMRYDLGFFYQLKIGQSDEKQFMRSLLDLSCIDPAERDPARFWGVDSRGRRVVKQAELEQFCRSYPRLVRRLRERMGRARPADVVAFLEDNKDVPSRFELPAAGAGAAQTPLRKPRDQWPILPNPSPLPTTLPDPAQREFAFSFDVNRASEAWYTYAQEPLPPPDPDEAVEERPFDAVHYRLPKMSTMVFRTYPARAQFYGAEQLEQEGWFDKDNGWTIRGWFEARPGSSRKRDVTVGTESKYHAAPAWARVYRAYLDFGQKNGLYYTPDQARRLEQKAQLYQQTYKVGPQEPARELPPAARTGAMRESLEAQKRLEWRAFYETLTNFNSFLSQAAAEQKEEAVGVRKLFFQAKELASLAARAQAMKTYEEALARWEEVLLAHPGLRRIDEVQLQTFEQQTRYLSLRQQQQADRLGPLVLSVLQFGLARPGVWPVADLSACSLFPFDPDRPATTAGPGEPALEFDPGLEKGLIPLRRTYGRFDMLYVYEVPESGQEDFDLRGLLLGICQAPSPVPLALSPYQKNHTLVVWTPADVRTSLSPVGWHSLLGDPAVEQMRQRRAQNLARRGQRPAGQRPR
jgi:hypothetical protein